MQIDIIRLIPVGKRNAVTRSQLAIMTGMSDRTIRQEISKARRTHVIINLQDNNGYYQPDMNDASEIAEIRRYVAQEESRIKSIGYSLKGARMALRGAQNE